ncbi:helix-turn-helix domain-containing protein [Sediminibacillus halophilus]|uniref:DNA-binding transcriptional regulator, XRE family n=1 Tax=Sediminibacillus halophilus TaxID=482461 RepID=A0A1G9T432_9BACI|nr:helix-turn-helix transcriptional regulator [Sediminibacillus halophilus]SDM42388.1 DNA-binding transcriptional regulator, XRE family [Sediminibacillus halophilus]
MTVKLRLSELLGIHKMSQKELAQKTGIRPATISAIYHEQIKRIDIDHINSLCKVLKCEPGDLIVYIEDDEFDTFRNQYSNKSKLKNNDMRLENSNHGLVIKSNYNTNLSKESENIKYNLTREYIEEILLDILNDRKKNKHND